VVRVFEDIATAGVIARNPQEKSQFRDPLLRMRAEMFRVVDASPTSFAAGLRREDFFGRPALLLCSGALFGADVGGAEECGGE